MIKFTLITKKRIYVKNCDIISGMSTFRYFQDVQTRYGDLDAQGHLNNSRYLTFIEQARLNYLIQLGVWDGVDFLNLPFIVADVHVAYLAPVTLNCVVRVWTRVTRLGHKSLNFEYRLEDAQGGKPYASAEVVVVAYDYREKHSIPIPESWREKIAAFEGISPAVVK